MALLSGKLPPLATKVSNVLKARKFVGTIYVTQELLDDAAHFNIIESLMADEMRARVVDRITSDMFKDYERDDDD